MNQAEAGQLDSWAFFDKIYCITLETRSDRRKQAEKQFADAGLLHRVEFICVAKHPVNQVEGIFQSHMFCLNKGLQEKARNILVFEDDVFFQGFNGAVLREVCRRLNSGIKWDALFLGCITDGSQKTGIRNLAKITYRCLAHAYALNQPFAEHIVQQNWNNIPFDEMLRRENREFYALYPMCAFQGRAGSDNQTVVIDRVRRIFGGLPFIQKANELYQNHKAMLLAPVAFVLVLVLLTLTSW